MKKIPNNLIASIVLLILAIGLYIASDKKVPEDVQVNTIVWSYETVGEEIAEPKTTVTVHIGDKKHAAGKYPGTCWERPAEDLEQNEVSGIRCWAAGGGDDLGVFDESGSLVVKHRIVEEGTPEDGGGFVGEFEPIVNL